MAGPDVVTVAEIVGQFVGEGVAETLPKVGEFLELRAQLGERRIGPKPRERGAQAGYLGEGVAHATQLPGIAQSVLQPAQNARNVADPSEQLMHLCEPRRLGD